MAVVTQRALGKPTTRAEQVRLRRARRRTEPGASERYRRPKRSRKAAPRRRRDLVLPGSAGVEIRLPALPALRIGPRLVSFALLGGWVLVVQGVWVQPNFKVDQPEVIGLETLPEAQIVSKADLEGKHVFTLDPAAIEAKLERYPEIDAAEVRIRWPNKVVIEVQERLPVVEWDDGGRIWWLSASGVASLQREERPGLVRVVAARPVLEIQSDANAPVIEAEVLRGALALQNLYPSLRQLTYDEVHGLGFMDPRGWHALFGHGDEIPMKVRLYESIAVRISAQGAAVETVSVEDLHTPYYTLAR